MYSKYSMDVKKKIAIYANFPITPTLGYITFFNEFFVNTKFVCVDVNNPRSADYAISFNHTGSNLRKIQDSNIPIEKRILVMYECKQILPEMHQKDILSQYGFIFSPSLNWARGFNPILFKYPLFLEGPIDQPPLQTRKYEFGLIQRNNLSCVKGELYTLRRQFLKSLTGRIEVRGEGWNKSRITQIYNYIKLIYYYRDILKKDEIIFIPRYLIKNKLYKRVHDKQKFLEEVQIAIIIENGADYVSEKLFDCFRAGTVPIYVGPSLIDFDIPEDCVISCQPLLESLSSLVNNIGEFNLNIIREKGSQFLRSEGQEWSEERAMMDLAKKIANVIK